MSVKPCKAVYPFADGEYLFALRLSQLFELEDTCSAGIGKIFLDISQGHYSSKQVYHIIRLGLIGGGMDPVKAKSYCDRYVDPNHPESHGLPIGDSWALALAIMVATIQGHTPDKKRRRGKEQGAEGTTSSVQTDVSTLQ